MRRTLMRTEVVRDAHGFLRAKCLAHADCIAAGMIVEQLTRDGKIKKPHLHKRHLFSKTGAVFRLNENFTEHLKNRDAVDGTNLAIQWKLNDKIHGPRSGFPEKNGDLEPLPWCKNVVTEAEAAEAAASDATERAIVSDATSIEEADVAPPADLTGTATALSLVSDLYEDSESDEDETASTTEVAGPCFWA